MSPFEQIEQPSTMWWGGALVNVDPVYATAWLAAGVFFVSRWSRLRKGRGPGLNQLSCAGLLMLVLHIVVAYGWAHNWSHVSAAEHVAERTEDFVGLRSSMGLYANFVVVVIWVVQIALAFEARIRSDSDRMRRVRMLAEIFLWFMFLNATSVFASWPSRAVFGFLAGFVAWDNIACRARRSSQG